MSASFEEFHELLCVIRNEQKRITEAVNKLNIEMKIKNKICFSLQEAAAETGFKYHTLYHMVETGKLKASQPGGTKGKVMVTREELVRLLEESAKKSSVDK
jgi:excisionase family DNA binding protein